MNSDRVRIHVDRVGKCFRLRPAGGRTLKSALVDLVRPRARGEGDFWAVRDVSFDVREGETLGIIGANGAGKSTLMAMLAGAKKPTTGTIRTEGTISSLLELGAGFHPDLSGRENIFLAGAVMGLSRQSMKARFDSIVEFAGLEKFIDQPVKHYSSGMYVRLGFSVAVEVDPDILLVDEVLAVGDSVFQTKCLRKMADFRRRRKSMVMISHDLGAVKAVSDRILILEEGRIAGMGDPQAEVRRYEEMTRERRLKSMEGAWGTEEARLTGVEFLDESGRPMNVLESGRPLTVAVHYAAGRRIDDPVFGFGVRTEHGMLVYGSNTQIEGFRIRHIEGNGVIRLVFPSAPFGRGTYLWSFSLHSADHRTNYHRLDNTHRLDVVSASNFEGSCHIPVRWEHPAGGR